MSEPKRDNRNRRARRNSRDKVRERGEKVQGARGRESKEGPTCQRERKVDAPEEREKSERSSFVSFGDTVQPALVPVRLRPPLQPTTSAERSFPRSKCFYLDEILERERYVDLTP